MSAKPPVFLTTGTVPYFKEPQGEAVCWAADLSGYYTISEGVHSHLYFYPRLVTSIMNTNNLPDDFKLYQNFPNPFNPTTIIQYSIPLLETLHATSQLVQLKVYDILGKEVETLVNKKQIPGIYQVQWDGRNKRGEKISSGIYIYHLKTVLFNSTKQMIFLE